MAYFSDSNEDGWSDDQLPFGGFEDPSIAEAIEDGELFPDELEDVLMGTAREDFPELTDGRILRAALFAKWPKHALEEILSAMGCRPTFKNPDALHLALMSGVKGAVELFSGEEYAELFSLKSDNEELFSLRTGKETKMMALVSGRLVSDREIVDLVAEKSPAEHFDPYHGDVLAKALKSQYSSDYAVEVCLRRGPSMADRLKGAKDRLKYVIIAARCKSVAMVEKLHELVPLLPDKSGRRSAREEYAEAIFAAEENREDRLGIMQFLVDAAGEGDEELVSWTVLLAMEKKEEAEWLLDYAPHLLTNLLEDERKPEDPERCNFCKELLENRYPLQNVILVYIRDNTSRKCIENLLASTLCAPFNLWMGQRYGPKDWRYQLKPLFDEVPEAWRGQQREALFYSIRDHFAKDVEYVLSVCTPADLRWQNGDGDTAYTLAKRLGRLPEKLVERLKVATKNPYA